MLLRGAGVRATILGRSYWIPGSYAPAVSEKLNAFLRLLNKKGFTKESMTTVVGRHRHLYDPGIQQERPELGAHYFDERRRHDTVDRWAQRIERLGYRVHLEPVATTAA